MNGPQRPTVGNGFTLVELTVVLAITGILAAVAIPPWREQLARARRADAVAALARLQLAQEQYRSVYGIYAPRLEALAGAASARSPEGWYTISLDEAGAEAFRASATARPDAAQSSDRECPRLSLFVRSGFVERVPGPRCWSS